MKNIRLTENEHLQLALIGKRLKSIRLERKISTRDSGLSDSCLRVVEAGEQSYHLWNLVTLANTYKVSLNEIFGATPIPFKKMDHYNVFSEIGLKAKSLRQNNLSDFSRKNKINRITYYFMEKGRSFSMATFMKVVSANHITVDEFMEL